MNHQTFVVTGATSGLGLATVRELAKTHHTHLVVGARNPAQALATKRAVPTERLTLLELDVSDFGSVRAFCAEVQKRPQPLDGLLLNAGIQLARGDLRSVDGFELTFATNHLGHFLMYELLAPHLTSGARVITVSSGTQNPNATTAKRFGFRDGVYTSAAALAKGPPDSTVSGAQQGRDAYAASKTANVLFANAMARRVSQVFLAYEPGAMAGTGLARSGSFVTRALWHTFARLLLPLLGGSTPERSGRFLASLLTNADCVGAGSGYFDFRGGAGHPHPCTFDQALQDELVTTSRRLCGVRSAV